jgi:hypothetical protein
MSPRVLVASFPDDTRLREAAMAAREGGLVPFESWSPRPFPSAGADRRERTAALLAPGVGAIVGLAGFAAQWFAARHDWPLALGSSFGGSPLDWLPVSLLLGLVAAAAVAWARLILAGRKSAQPAPGFCLALATDHAGFDHRDATLLLLRHGAESVDYAELKR